MDSYRVTEVIRKMKYDRLVKSGVIPDIKPTFLNIPLKRFPKYVYTNKGFQFFGMIMDFVIRAGIAGEYPVISMGDTCTSKDLGEIIEHALYSTREMFGEDGFSLEDLLSSKNFFKAATTKINDKLKSFEGFEFSREYELK